MIPSCVCYINVASQSENTISLFDTNESLVPGEHYSVAASVNILAIVLCPAHSYSVY